MAGEEIFVAMLFSGMALGGALGVAGMIMKGILTKRTWPIWVPVAVQHGSSVVWDLENRGRLITRADGTEAMEMNKEREGGRPRAIKVPKYHDFAVTKKGAPVYPVFKTTTGQYFAMSLDRVPNLDVVEDKSSKNWAMGEHNRLNIAYGPKENFWTKVMPYLMQAAFAGMMIFFMIYFSQTIGNAASQLAGASTALADAVLKMTGPR